jgi:B-cell receptor-associated protein 31
LACPAIFYCNKINCPLRFPHETGILSVQEMGVQFELVRAVLVCEIVLFFLLALPFPNKWYAGPSRCLILWRIRRRRAFEWASQSTLVRNLWYVFQIIYIFVFILFIGTSPPSFVHVLKRLVDSTNRSIKTSSKCSGLSRDDNHMLSFIKDTANSSQLYVKTFYAQRNMYLTGFTLLMAL